MRVEVHRPTELDAPALARWREVQRSDPRLSNPFLSPEFACAADRARPGVRVAVVYDGPPCSFFAYSVGKSGMAGPVAPGFTDLQGLVGPPASDVPLRSVLEAAGVAGLRFDHLEGSDAPAPGKGVVVRDALSWLIELDGGWDDYREWAHRERRRYLNWLERKERRLWREHPEARFEYDTGHHDDLLALMRLKSAQCQQRGWVDIFAVPWRRQMVEELLGDRSSTLRGVVSVLKVGEVPIAADFSLRSRATYAGWHIAYDPRWQQYSPGAVRWRLLLEALAADSPVTIDLGKGADEFKTRFSNQTRPLAEGFMSVSGRGRLACGGHRLASLAAAAAPGLEERAQAAVWGLRRRRYQRRAARA